MPPDLIISPRPWSWLVGLTWTATVSSLPRILPSAVYGYRLLSRQHVFAPPGLEGFRPAFHLAARTGFLSRQSAANETIHIAGARTVFSVTGCASTIPIGRIPWQQQRLQSNQA
jgi:hypothetical protein